MPVTIPTAAGPSEPHRPGPVPRSRRARRCLHRGDRRGARAERGQRRVADLRLGDRERAPAKTAGAVNARSTPPGSRRGPGRTPDGREPEARRARAGAVEDRAGEDVRSSSMVQSVDHGPARARRHPDGRGVVVRARASAACRRTPTPSDTRRPAVRTRSFLTSGSGSRSGATAILQELRRGGLRRRAGVRVANLVRLEPPPRGGAAGAAGSSPSPSTASPRRRRGDRRSAAREPRTMIPSESSGHFL